MKTIPLKAYEVLLKDAVPVGPDVRGPNVLRLAGGEYAKRFRRKRFLSSSTLRPYASRFAAAARELRKRGVPTVEVVDVFRVDEGQYDTVVYWPLSGETLRDELQSSSSPGDLLFRFADFLAALHRRGVYFRGIHLGNVLVMDDGRFGLIDVVGSRCWRRPLGLVGRVRNFKPLVRSESDEALIVRCGGRAFVDRYAQASGLTGPSRALLVRILARNEAFASEPAAERIRGARRPQSDRARR